MKVDPVIQTLTDARIKLLIEWPIFGPIILHLELKEVDWCGTAATDGRFFYYNREFVKKLNKAEIMFLTAHEVLHCVYDHIFRRGNRNKDLWNMAVDYLVNYSLIHTKDAENKTIGSKIDNIPPVTQILYDPAYTDEFSADELYALLEKKKVNILPSLDMHLDGDGDGKGEGKKKKKDNGDGENEAEGDGKNEDKDGKGDGDDGPPSLTEAEKEAIREVIQATILQAAQQPNIDPGKIPAGILRMLNRLLEPKIDWRQMLDNVLRSAIKYDHTYLRVSRRFWTTGLILPGRNVQDKVEAVAWLDGSGSTTQEMVTDFLSECKGIMDTFRDFELTIGTFDTKVYNVKKFTPENADEIESYDFHGGGGTVPSCCWNWMKENEILPHRILLFTDGYVDDDWGDPDYCDTLFIIHSNPRVKASHGITVHYDEKAR